MFFKKKKLTSHQKAIAITYLLNKIHQLEDSLLGKEDEDTWGIKHDIDCLKATIEFLD